MTQRHRSELGLALLLLVAYGWLFVFFPRINNPNELVRIYMARAIAEQHSFAIGRRDRVAPGRLADTGPLFAEWGWVNDRSLVCDDARLKGPNCPGALYSGKAPGVSLFAAPIVFVANELFRALAHRSPSKDEYVLVLRWLLAILPSVALWLCIRRFLSARGIDGPLSLAIALAGACGSLSFTFGQMVAGHQLTGIALAVGFLAVFWPDRSPLSPSESALPPSDSVHAPRESARAAVLGFALAASVLLEYQSAPAAFLIALAWLVARWLPARLSARAPVRSAGGGQLLLYFFLGALPMAALFVWFHTVVYGAPWRTGYSFLENAGFQRDIAPGFLGISIPTGERVWGSFFSPAMGLFFFAPWTALVLGALPLAFRSLRQSWPFAKITENTNFDSSAAARAKLLALPAALSVVFYYLAFQSMHALWRSGWTVGPRYITPLVPFAAIALALCLQELAPAARALGLGLLGGAAAAAIGATGVASSVCQGFPEEPTGPLAEVVAPLLAHGWVPRNLLQLAGVPGLWSAIPTFIALGVAALLCLTAPLRSLAPPIARKRGLILALAIFALLTLGQWTSGLHRAPWPAASFLSSQWTPASPPGATPFAR